MLLDLRAKIKMRDLRGGSIILDIGVEIITLGLMAETKMLDLRGKTIVFDLKAETVASLWGEGVLRRESCFVVEYLEVKVFRVSSPKGFHDIFFLWW